MKWYCITDISDAVEDPCAGSNRLETDVQMFSSEGQKCNQLINEWQDLER